MQQYFYTVGLITIMCFPNAHAEIVLDGSWGGTDALNGPNFDIRAGFGQQVGNNLFHSFQTFNLYQK